MRLAPLIAPLLIAALLAAGCSRSDSDKLKADTQAVGHDVATDVRKVGDDPNLKAAGAQLKAGTQKAGEDLHKAGQDISQHTKAAADETKNAVNR
jgi:hypothetical protein